MSFSAGDPSRNPSSHPMLSYADGIAAAWTDTIILAGRVAVGWIYMQSGCRKIWDMAAVAKTSGARPA